MIDDTDRKEAAETMSRINHAWLYGDIADLETVMHPDIVVVFPGFAGSVRGRSQLIASFHEFRNSAAIRDFREDARQVDAIGGTAVVSFHYEMHYEHSRERFRATGRDPWVFQKQIDTWSAVWRTILDVDEQPA